MTDTATAQNVATIIKSQIGFWNLAKVGAHNFAFTSEAGGGLTFLARIAPAGQSRVRIMRVTVLLNAADEYDVSVGYLKKFDWVDHAGFEGVQAESLGGLIASLDA